MNSRIYLDHAATTPLLPEVIETMLLTMKNISGNASSIHREGVIAKNVIEESRKVLASFLSTSPSQVFFTSGATESNNIILSSAIESGKYEHLITSPLEHPAVINCIQFHAKNKLIQIHYLNPDRYGRIDSEELENLLIKCGKNAFVSLIHTHNELGTLINAQRIAEICQNHGAKFHSDTVQSIGLYDINVTELGYSSIVGSAHKFNGPKGIGFMYLQEPAHITPLFYGGNQERNMRAGTENIIGITGMIKALEIAQKDRILRFNHISHLNQRMRTGIIERKLSDQFNSPIESVSPKILNVYFEERKDIDWLIMNLDIEGIAVSGGSACSSGTEKSSHINEYLRPNSKGRSIRFSFSHLNTEAEIDQTLDTLSKLLS